MSDNPTAGEGHPTPWFGDRELSDMLLERRRRLREQVQRTIQGVRQEERSSGRRTNLDDDAETDIQEDIELAVVQMRSEALDRIDDALLRLARGCYGVCVECHHGIAKSRLRALPFALRCRQCEEMREVAQRAGVSLSWR